MIDGTGGPANGTIYGGSSGGNTDNVDGELYAVTDNGTSCTVKGAPWPFVPAAGISSNGVLSSPAIGGYDGTIYFGSNDHNLYAVTTAGTAKWSVPFSGPANYVISSPAAFKAVQGDYAPGQARLSRVASAAAAAIVPPFTSVPRTPMPYGSSRR